MKVPKYQNVSKQKKDKKKVTEYDKKIKEESDQKRRRIARANRDDSVEIQVEKVSLKPMQNYKANYDESVKIQQNELNSQNDRADRNKLLKLSRKS